ncbi:MAG: UDP-glucose 6-dehydrogenase [Chloroflexi bacterium]|nr:UDP-glucose 6-dehydrogenase [Chloroflexota bacterium]|tara:strand:- start:5917 stop:7239 length:1323 start_codon:yes stop_codon:yes gene_type:complete
MVDTKMRVGIVGLGFVGLSLSSVLASKDISTIGIDTDKEKCKMIASGKPPFFEPELEKTLKEGLSKKFLVSDDFSLLLDCELIFVTVGTPQRDDGSIELGIIKDAIRKISQIIGKSKKSQTVIIKSTVVPGTMKNVILPILEKGSRKKAGKEFGLISNPEFLQESSAIKNTKFPHLIILGGYQTQFMRKFGKFLTKIHPDTKIVVTNHQTAEMIKYANNSFLATKISFINQLSNICQKIPEVNIDEIAKTIGLDPRIGQQFLNAGPGYGGSCLPKDMKALINFSNKVGVKPVLLNAVEEINVKQLNQIISLLEKKLGKINSKKITIFGTSFKPNTDDVRDSISIQLIKKLLKKKANIIVFDPRATGNTRKIFGKKISYANSMNNALDKSQCLIIMTHWKQFEKLDQRYLKLMNKKLIIDCRRIFTNKKFDAEYIALGLGK